MSVVRRNLVANYAGGIWASLLNLLLIPVYIRFLGAEAYGLIGVFAAVQGLLGLLDLGLGATFNRELARRYPLPERHGEMRPLVRTGEAVYWVVGLLICASLLAVSGLLAESWVQAERLPVATVRDAVMLMALSMLFQWPTVLYVGGLEGMQRHVLLNGVTATLATVRGLGAVGVLLVTPTVHAFFGWQLLVSIVHVLAIRTALWRSLPPTTAPVRFDLQQLRQVWRFAAGMTAISAVSLLLTQADKIILSRMLTLELFGYYTVATVAAGSLYRVITPVFGAVFPRLSELVSHGDSEALRRVYHRSCQLIAVLVLPAAAVVALFSKELLFLWTRDPEVVRHAHLVLSLWVIGTALNGMVTIPYALQLAHGWTRLTILTNLVAVAAMIPGMIVATRMYGPAGAAAIWVTLNLGYYLVQTQLMFRRLLPEEKWRWYTLDTAVPMLVALVVAGGGRAIAESVAVSSLNWLVAIVLTSLATVVATSATVPWMWQEVRRGWRRLDRLRTQWSTP